mgnify:FL=1
MPGPDELKGRVPELYVSLKPGFTASPELSAKIAAAVADHIGPIARPKHVWIVPDMPKTRSGKIMRRILTALSTKSDTGDITTLANPEVVEMIRATVQKKG